MNTREQCGITARPLFEKAAIAYFASEDGYKAGKAQMEAQVALYECLGIKPTFDVAISETERWFSFFNLFWCVKLIDKGEYNEALIILKDQEESYSPERAPVLSITADYGEQKTNELYSLTKAAKEALVSDDISMARLYSDKAADLQYNLAVERAGIPL